MNCYVLLSVPNRTFFTMILVKLIEVIYINVFIHLYTSNKNAKQGINQNPLAPAPAPPISANSNPTTGSNSINSSATGKCCPNTASHWSQSKLRLGSTMDGGVGTPMGGGLGERGSMNGRCVEARPCKGCRDGGMDAAEVEGGDWLDGATLMEDATSEEDEAAGDSVSVVLAGRLTAEVEV